MGATRRKGSGRQDLVTGCTCGTGAKYVEKKGHKVVQCGKGKGKVCGKKGVYGVDDGDAEDVGGADSTQELGDIDLCANEEVWGCGDGQPIAVPRMTSRQGRLTWSRSTHRLRTSTPPPIEIRGLSSRSYGATAAPPPPLLELLGKHLEYPTPIVPHPETSVNQESPKSLHISEGSATGL